MKLSVLTGIAPVKSSIAFTGVFTTSGKFDSDGFEYMIGKLLAPVKVRCSVVPEMDAEVCDELFVRESLATSDLWEAVNADAHKAALDAGKLQDYKEGFHVPTYVADFSKNQEIPIYQDQTISKWARGNRKDKAEGDKQSFLEKMEARKAARS